MAQYLDNNGNPIAPTYLDDKGNPVSTKETPKPSSWFSTAKDLISKGKANYDRAMGDTATGPNGEKASVKGPDMMEIPGVSRLASGIKNKLQNTGNWYAGAAGSILSDILNMGASGIDPRAAVVGKDKVLEPIAETPKPRLALPPAPESALKPATFVAGPSGAGGKVLPVNAPLQDQAKVAGLIKETPSGTATPANLDQLAEQKRLAALKFTEAEQYPGSRLSVPNKDIELPRQSGDTAGGFAEQSNGPLKYPLNVVPNSVRPRASQTEILGRSSLRGMDISTPPAQGSDINFISGGVDNIPERPVIDPEYYIGDPNAPPELPSAKKIKQVEPVSKPSTLDTAGAPEKQAIPQVKTNDKAISNNTPVNRQSVKDAVKRWAYGQQGATFKGNLAKETFADLTDPKLVDAYESGDRTGRLADVQKFLDEHLARGKNEGLFAEGQERPNYLRHEYEQSPEEVKAAVKAYIAKDPSIAKTGKFQTYSQAELAGLARKYKTIPEILDAYVSKFNRASKNKEFHDFLTSNGLMDSGDLIKSPDNWTFKGEHAKDLQNWVGNVLDQRRPLKGVANFVSNSKNLALGGGVPKTPLNMHMYNVTRSDIMARGVKAGLGDFFQGVFNPKRDIETIKSNGKIIGELIDSGLGWSNIEDHAALGSGGENATKNLLGKAGQKVMDAQTKLFEDPLFKIHLPAIKLRMAIEKVKELEPKIGKEAALKQAATEANDFYGGLNKVLRNKTIGDLSRIGLLAPDWLESRLNIAVKGAKSLVGKESSTYAKATGRALGMRATGAGATALATGALANSSNRGSNSTSIPLGKTSTGKNRELPIYGSAAEGLRLPEDAIADSKNGRLNEIGNMATSRISIPARAALNLGFNRDDFGKPLYGRDDYGRQIPTSKAVGNIAGQAGQTILPPAVVALIDLLSGKDPEASISKGIESPLNYNTEERDSNSYPKGAPRFRFR